jgi:predicted outer membrane repeat protein
MNVGGGIYIRSRSNPVLTNCSFTNNMQISNPLGSGGGACVYGGGDTGGQSYPTFMGCDFVGNTVNGDGGGLSAAYRSHPKLINCTFRDNHAGRSGGGLACVADADHVYPSNAEVDGCLFENNSASEEGGAIHVRNSDPIFNNSRIEGNTANFGGGGINFFESPLSYLANSVLCNNSPTSIEGNYSDGGGNSIADDCADCEGDANGDGVVNIVDLLGAVGDWGFCDGCEYDIDGNGVVDVTDVLLIVGNWGNCG